MANKTLSTLPDLATTYGGIMASLVPINRLPIIRRWMGTPRMQPTDKDRLPDATYTVDFLSIDATNLKNYRRICGFDDTNHVPPTYFCVLSQMVQMNMMAQEPFPFAILGLVHINNSVTQYRRIDDTETLSMQVSFANLQEHDKGQQFDFVTKVYDADNELIWQGTSTYLARQKTNKKNTAAPAKAFFKKPEPQADDVHHIFAVSEDIGRRYAKVSGDFNLIHIHPITAKAFGFKTAIAHGMWSKAKCLSVMNLPAAYTVDVAFKLPIFLPAEIELIGDNQDTLIDSGKAQFALYQAGSDKPHLMGEIRLIQEDA